MTPDLKYTTGGECKDIEWDGKQTDPKPITAFQTSYTNKLVITAVRWGYFDSRSLR